jgi:alkanesulfonate monooxygenase SsuD/methylene tetrahydromethanopterin reductase-like flavin-dependent oxidoreductase (luciferase family)|tara:strand:+ start:1108 stop:1932 length:825 start_codon:yes stop_codon:yes gene_type:complete
LKFGLTIPVTIGKNWRKNLLDSLPIIENSGISSLLVWDHYMLPEKYGEESNNTIDAWTLLSFIAANTTKIKLGTCVTPIPFRPPQILAKIVSSLDNISNGRIILGIGAGWHKPEFDGYSEWNNNKIRFEKTVEGIEIMKKLWTEDQVSFSGKYYKIEDAILEPKPIQKPYPELWFGTTGDKMLKLMAKYGAAWIPVGINSESYNKFAEYIKTISKKKITLTYYDHRDIGTYNINNRINEYEKVGCEYFIGLLRYESGNMKQKLKQFSDIISSYN